MPDPYAIMFPVRAIQLTKGKYAIIDPEDYDLVSQHTWHARLATGNKTYHAATNILHPKGGMRLHTYGYYTPKEMAVSMHVLIMGRKGIDHINRNMLDNRRANLRIATDSQNGMNRGQLSNNSSGHVGVREFQGGWRVDITVNKQRTTICNLESYDDAVEIRHELQYKYFGAFSPIDCCDGRKVI